MNPIVETTAANSAARLVDGIAAFRSVPYGASTAGAARFMPPRPPAPWAGVRDALDYAGQAPQARLGPAPRAEMADFSGPADASPETEDCLTLNVWTPAADSAARRPVMVWLHGGAFSYGSANSRGCKACGLCAARRRRGGDGQPSAEHLRPSRSVGGRRRGIRAVRQCRHARHGRRAALGARQHRRRSAAIPATSRSSANPAAAERSARCWPCRRRAGCSTAPSCRAARRCGCARAIARRS